MRTSRRNFLGLLPLTVAAGTAPPLASGSAQAAGATATATATGATEPGGYISPAPRPGSLPLVAAGKALPLVVSSADHPGVVRAVGDLRDDITRVTGVTPAVATDRIPAGQREVVLIGTIGVSPLIDRLIETGRLDVTGIAGRWETTVEQIVERPVPGVGRAFVIAGSDQRGTVYGIYETSRQLGVSPWYWWNDVPAARHQQLHVLPGRHSQGTPAVKYRGLFINGEDPALGTWAQRFFGPGHAPGHEGGFNAAFHEKVFEVMLRLKANYFWPAVRGRAFAEDDPANHATATAYGIVLGTSPEAPMMRGIEEWNRHAVPARRDEHGEITVPGTDPYGGTGEWSFRRNSEAVMAYWADGIRRMREQDIEGVVTLGMRGAGDLPLPDGDGVELMEEILASQRAILAELSGDTELTAIPQVQTLYKEVQRYWDQGLRPPDDVTVVFCDDDWGNMRRLPDPALPERAGGYGLSYHFDHVGEGRAYAWVDTVNLANTWEQLHLSYRYGVDRLWVANCGDMKGEELPLQFFLDYAWDPERWPVERLEEWRRHYAAQSFGPEHAEAIGEILHTYGVLQARRKPELLNRRITLDPGRDLATDPAAVVHDDQATPFSLTDYRELDRVTAEWEALDAEAERIGRLLHPEQHDAYYQLVQYQVEATANLYALRRAEFTNLHYADQGRAMANWLATVTDARFADDQAMSDYYNTVLAEGKWDGFQTRPKIGYGDVARYGPDTSWRQPGTADQVPLPDEVFPPPRRITVPEVAEMGVAIDGSDQWWPHSSAPAVLPVFSPYQSQPEQFIDVFNRGSVPFGYRVTVGGGAPWLTVTPARGRVDLQQRVTIGVDWTRAPKGDREVPLTVTGPGGVSVEVLALIENPAVPARGLKGFIEANGYVSMEAEHADRAVNTLGVTWVRLPGIGRTGGGMTPFPVTAPPVTPGGAAPRLEYVMTLFTAGEVDVWAYLSPRNSVLTPEGLRYAVSIDDDEPQLVDITEVTGSDDTAMNVQWARTTADNATVTMTTHRVSRPGRHTLKFWMVDPTVIVQKLVVDTGGLKQSYLGPPESTRR